MIFIVCFHIVLSVAFLDPPPSRSQATKDAVVIAGINFLLIVNEPTAAAIAYDLVSILEEEPSVCRC